MLRTIVSYVALFWTEQSPLDAVGKVVVMEVTTQRPQQSQGALPYGDETTVVDPTAFYLFAEEALTGFIPHYSTPCTTGVLNLRFFIVLLCFLLL